MKQLNNLTRAEKITFLKMIQAGEAKPKELKKPVFFATQRGDSFTAMMAMNASGEGSIIPLTPEAKEDLKELQKAMNVNV